MSKTSQTTPKVSRRLGELGSAFLIAREAKDKDKAGRLEKELHGLLKASMLGVGVEYAGVLVYVNADTPAGTVEVIEYIPA